MVCLRNISVDTMHKGDTNDDDDDDDDNNILNPNDTTALFLFTKLMLYKILTKLLICQNL